MTDPVPPAETDRGTAAAVAAVAGVAATLTLTLAVAAAFVLRRRAAPAAREDRG